MFKIISVRFPKEIYEYIRTYSFNHGYLHFSKGLFKILRNFIKNNPLN